MYSGRLGLRTHQQMMDRHGNILANVCTPGLQEHATVLPGTP
jgi:flagellar hook protein FlgE